MESNLIFVERQRLRPGTDWEKRREIRALETEVDRLWRRIYRVSIAIGLNAVVALLACVIGGMG